MWRKKDCYFGWCVLAGRFRSLVLRFGWCVCWLVCLGWGVCIAAAAPSVWLGGFGVGWFVLGLVIAVAGGWGLAGWVWLVFGGLVLGRLGVKIYLVLFGGLGETVGDTISIVWYGKLIYRNLAY